MKKFNSLLSEEMAKLQDLLASETKRVEAEAENSSKTGGSDADSGDVGSIGRGGGGGGVLPCAQSKTPFMMEGAIFMIMN